MMKKKYWITLSLVLSSTICVISFVERMNVGLLVDKLNLTHNTIHVEFDENISLKDLYIYWLSEGEYSDESLENRLLIFHKKKQCDIPDTYGKNRFLIKYKNILYYKAGILKKYAYSKYHYNFNFRLEDNIFIVDWKIQNWYDPYIYQGIDSLEISFSGVN